MSFYSCCSNAKPKAAALAHIAMLVQCGDPYPVPDALLINNRLWGHLEACACL